MSLEITIHNCIEKENGAVKVYKQDGFGYKNAQVFLGEKCVLERLFLADMPVLEVKKLLTDLGVMVNHISKSAVKIENINSPSNSETHGTDSGLLPKD